MTIANPATLEDVKLERPLTDSEQDVVPYWLDQAWTILQGDVPGIPTRMLLPPGSPTFLNPGLVVQVLAAMVERKLRNTDGLRSWTADDVTQTIDATLSTGQLYSTPDERARLAIPVLSGGIYSLQFSR